MENIPTRFEVRDDQGAVIAYRPKIEEALAIARGEKDTQVTVFDTMAKRGAPLEWGRDGTVLREKPRR